MSTLAHERRQDHFMSYRREIPEKIINEKETGSRMIKQHFETITTNHCDLFVSGRLVPLPSARHMHFSTLSIIFWIIFHTFPRADEFVYIYSLKH